MRLGIDASNISVGGGVTHLVEMLSVAQPLKYGFDSVTIWSSSATLDQIPERPWLHKFHDPMLDRALVIRLYWQRFVLPKYLHQEKCDVLLVPGGSFLGTFRPFITMSRNMLPFEWRESRRYKISWMCLKMNSLRYMQIHTFKRGDGLIFLTKYAHDSIIKNMRRINGLTTVIPHGMNNRFPHSPRIQQSMETYTNQNPLNILYVSTVDVFKHQWHLAEAVSHLKSEHFPIHLDLIGGAYPPALKRLRQALSSVDPTGSFISYQGSVPYGELHNFYHKADVFVFASSCENLPNILIEAMAAGLPIACSNRGPMPEVLGDAGVYFDPENPAEIADALRSLINNPKLRAEKADLAFKRSMRYTWEGCANSTFDFISKIAQENVKQ